MNKDFSVSLSVIEAMLDFLDANKEVLASRSKAAQSFSVVKEESFYTHKAMLHLSSGSFLYFELSGPSEQEVESIYPKVVLFAGNFVLSAVEKTDSFSSILKCTTAALKSRVARWNPNLKVEAVTIVEQ